MADLIHGSLHSMKVIAEEFKQHLPRELFKVIMSVYFTIGICVDKDIPFAERLNGGKEITDIVLLLVGYVMLLVLSARRYIIEFKKGETCKRRATMDFAIHLFMALEIFFIFCYSVGGGSAFASLFLAVSIIAVISSVLIVILYVLLVMWRDLERDKREGSLFLGSGLFGIIKHSFFMDLAIWIYYGAVINSDRPVTERYERFAIVVKISGAALSGIYTGYLCLTMIIISCCSLNLDMHNTKWYLANRALTFIEYLMLLIYCSTSSVAIIIIFECFYLLKFTLTVIYLCRHDDQYAAVRQRLNTRINTNIMRQIVTGNGSGPNTEDRMNGGNGGEGRVDIALDQVQVLPSPQGQVNQSAGVYPNPAIANPAPEAIRDPTVNSPAGVRQLSESEQRRPPPMEVINIQQQEENLPNQHYPAPYRPPRTFNSSLRYAS